MYESEADVILKTRFYQAIKKLNPPGITVGNSQRL